MLSVDGDTSIDLGFYSVETGCFGFCSSRLLLSTFSLLARSSPNLIDFAFDLIFL